MNKFLNWLIAVLAIALGVVIYAMLTLNPDVLLSFLAIFIVGRILVGLLFLAVMARLVCFFGDAYAELSPEERETVHRGGKFFFRLFLKRMKRHPKYSDYARDVEETLGW